MTTVTSHAPSIGDSPVAIDTATTITAANHVGVAAGGAIGAAPQPDGKGFWTVTAAGAVTAYGQASAYGDLSGTSLNAPVVAIASTPDGDGYWLVASDGGIFAFGDAGYYGSTGSLHLNAPIVGMAATADGHGYWLVASDGGIFTFGNATFKGSTGGMHLNAPIVGMAATADGHGYWLVASDGGIFTFGDAGYYGSAAGSLGSSTAVGVVATTGGYWITTFGGSVLSYGGAPVLQSPVQTSSSIGTSNPSTNVPPTPAFEAACYSSTPSAACDTQALSLIDSARSGEGLGPLVLPANYSSLPATQQLFVVVNAERTSRGLPAFSGLNASLNSLATSGAQAVTDPNGPPGVSWASNLAWGLATPLASDFEWMYDDGIGSNNVDCTTSDTNGCWGHRENVLVSWSGSMGDAVVSVGGSLSMTELFAKE
jgi:hypothetical protein